jgi:hypothetical protein
MLKTTLQFQIATDLKPLINNSNKSSVSHQRGMKSTSNVELVIKKKGSNEKHGCHLNIVD